MQIGWKLLENQKNKENFETLMNSLYVSDIFYKSSNIPNIRTCS